jgi:aminopeptidase N
MFLYRQARSQIASIGHNILKARNMCTTTSASNSGRRFPDTSLHEQLPRNIIPTHYDVKCYDIDHVKNVFKGTVCIDFQILENTKSITLNQKLLNFDQVTIKDKSINVEIIKHDENETVEFQLESELSKDLGTAQIIVEYNGEIRTDMAGFYTSNYKDEKTGNTEYILATQFESTDARSAFPCYDEPNCKAQFTISIEVSKDLQVLSNMPVNQITESANGNQVHTFDKTPKMSTYLVAWAIGKFEYVEAHTDREYNGKKLPIRVYTIPGQSETGRYALETANSAVNYLSTIFDIDYPLPKLDLLAVPQFGANAMENWGLVMFRATALLYDPETSSSVYKQKVSYVVSHEIAHSWFGNYCTMNWWSDLWLNESFATYVGWLCVENMHPEWDVFTDFISVSMQTALDLDSLKNSHPVEVQVYHANEIDEIFDAISYLKGGSVVRMVSESIGQDLFLKGVSNYLKKYSFGNAKSDDLWDAVSEVSGKNITELVEPWIRAVGYPALKVTSNEADDGKTIKISQERFLIEGTRKEDDEITWWIPNVDNMQTKDKVISSDNFLKLNQDTNGFYRVFYDDKLMANIVANLEKLSAKDKIGLIADASAGARAGIIKTSQFLELVNQLKNESHVAVWSEIIAKLSILKNSFYSDKEISEKLVAFSRDLYRNKFEELIKSDSLDFNGEKLASTLFEQAGISQFEVAVSKALQIFQSKDIKPLYRQAVYKILVSNETTCNDEIFQCLLDEVRHPTTIDGREVALRSLGALSKVDEYLPKVLDLFFDGSVPEMDYQFLAIPLASNAGTKAKFWEFFKENYPKFRSDVSMWTLDRVIKGFLPKLVSAELSNDVETFFGDKDNTGYEKGLKQSIDSIRNDVRWNENARENVREWLVQNGY